MNAKTELARRICETFPGGTPITVEAVTAILKDYIIIKDSDEQRSDLNRRIKYYYGEEYGVFFESKENEGTNATIIIAAKNIQLPS